MAKGTDHELIIPCAGIAINGSSCPIYTDTDTWRLPTGSPNGYPRNMALSERQIFDALSQMPFTNTTELASILVEPPATVHRSLTHLRREGLAGRVNHGTALLSTSLRYFLSAKGVKKAAKVLGYDSSSDYVRAYPMSKEWLTLLIRRMDAVSYIYRLAASLSRAAGGLRSRVEIFRRGRFDAAITLDDGRRFGVVRQGLALRRRSLFDRLRTIVEYDFTRRPEAILILTPTEWEKRLTARFCIDRSLQDCYVTAESREALEDRRRRLWQQTSFLVEGAYCSLETVASHKSYGGWASSTSSSRKRASIPDPERMVKSAPTFGLKPSEKRVLDLVTDHPMIPRKHLSRWLGVSEGRISRMMGSLIGEWGLVERYGQRGDTRYTLSDEGIRYVTHRDRAQLPTTRGIWSTALTIGQDGRRRHVGHRIDTWARQTKHADGVTWFLSKLADEARADPSSWLRWSVPTARSDRSFHWGEAAISPDAVGEIITGGLHIPFFFEYELRARHPRGVVARLRPYIRYYHHPDQPRNDLPPFPTTLFVVDRDDVEATYVRTAARMTLMSIPVLVSCIPVLLREGILGRSWHRLWHPDSRRLALSELDAYSWDSLRSRIVPVE